MRNTCLALSGCAMLLASTTGPADAYEQGYPGYGPPPGITLANGTAALPPEGLYAFESIYTYQARIVGPGAAHLNGALTKVNVETSTTGMLFVPGWKFLGADYAVSVIQPVTAANIGALAPQVPAQLKTGMSNTKLAPILLSWNLWDSGFFLKTGLSVGVPDGTMKGPVGLGSIGNPWYTFQPELSLSYLSKDWTLTANMALEISDRSSMTQYRTGDVFHAELAAIRKMGKWRFGPIAYYAGQVSDDSAGPLGSYYTMHGYPLGFRFANRWDQIAVGGLVGYDFGPVAVSLWGTDEVYAKAHGGSSRFGVADTATISQGWKVFTAVAFKLY